MPSPSDFNLELIARLARIALTDEEKARFSEQLGDVLAYVEQLKEVDVSGVEATAHAHPLSNIWGEDEARPGLAPEQALRNAPERHDGLFVVPKVVD
ncbi:MAG: Asp-tRNA(Asn)/Glu-tRNA(Gln) amidotransferase subunit GatC [Opitutaceae bacterium]